jgi:hypothetical protein
MLARWPLVCCTLLVCAFAAHGHVVYGTKTLHGLVSESDLVLRARIVAVDAGPRPTGESPSSGRPGVEAEVLDVLKGSFDAPRVRFAQHGHGVAQFEPEDEALVALVRITRSRELQKLADLGTYEWLSLQESQDEYRLDADSRKPTLDAVRAYISADRAASPEARIRLLQSATLGLLTSGDSRLAASAVRDLVLSPTLPLVTPEDVPTLESILNDRRSSMSMGIRVGLLVELERRGLVEAPSLWLSLLAADQPPTDRLTAIRAAGSSSSPRVRARLVSLLKDPDVAVAAAAASALGATGNVAAVEPLADALGHDSANVRMAAIRGLGRIDSPPATLALEHAADSHPDPATQRRALAEVRKRDDLEIAR